MQAGPYEHRATSGAASLPPPPAGALDALGGPDGVDACLDALYERIEGDPELAPVFPHFHASGIASFFRRWLAGGPALDSPWDVALHRRHLALHVAPRLAGRWLGHFSAMLEARGCDHAIARALLDTLRPIARDLAHADDAELTGLELGKSCATVSSHAMRSFAELQVAARRGRTDEIARALDADPSLARRRGEDGASLLWTAAGSGKSALVELLCAAGADPNAPAATPFQADMACSSSKPVGTIVALSPHAWALARSKRRCAETLVQAGAVVDALSLAHAGERDALARALDAEPASLTALDPAEDGREVTPLHHAIAAGQLDCAALCIERGAEVRRHSRFLLTVSARLERPDLVELLLDAGADAARAELIGPLDAEERPIAALLTAAGFHPDSTERWGAMLPRACRADVSKNRVHRAAVLLDLGADPNVLGRAGLGALHYAVRGRDPSLVRLLIARGARTDLEDTAGRLPAQHIGLSRSKRDPRPVLEALGR